MKPKEIRELSAQEKEDKIHDMQEELFNLRFQMAIGKSENPSRLRLIRRDIAKIKTVQREQVLQAKTEADK